MACFRDFEPTSRLGVVREVVHSLDFTTALIELTVAAAKVVPDRTHVYVNVWTSRNRSGVRRGFAFCRVRNPLSDMKPQNVKEAVGAWRRGSNERETAKQDIGGETVPPADVRESSPTACKGTSSSSS